MRLVTGGITIALILAGLAYRSYLLDRAAEKRRLYREQLAVSELPPGTFSAWSTYVDGRIDAVLKPNGQLIRVITTESNDSSDVVYVSRNAPYILTCHQHFWASAEFGARDASITVSIYGWEKDEPVLGVDRLSVAAKNLSAALCERVALKLQAIFSSPQFMQSGDRGGHADEFTR